MRVDNNIQTLPTYIIGMLMCLLLHKEFEDYFNVFGVWVRIQRPSMILSLLNELHLCAMYKFGNMGVDADKTCFLRFHIAEELGVTDAILYRRFREILRRSGNVDAHFT